MIAVGSRQSNPETGLGCAFPKTFFHRNGTVNRETIARRYNMGGNRLVIGMVFFSAALFCAAAGPRIAYAFPEDQKPISWLVGSQPGGGFDVHSRVVARGLRKHLGTNVIIKNIPGAGGVLAWNQLWASKPDGYTVAIINIPGAIVTELFGKPKPQYRLRELSWIGRISSGPYIWGVGAKTPYRNLKDLQNAKEVIIAEQSTGATSWLVHALTADVMGIPARITLGYPSAPASATAVVRGEAEVRAMGMDSPGQMQFIRDGSIRPLWVYLEKRDPEFPDVPTVAELGYPELTGLESNRVVAAPPGVPPETLAIWRSAFGKAMDDPEVKEQFKKIHAWVDISVGDQYKPILDRFFNVIQKRSRIFPDAMK